MQQTISNKISSLADQILLLQTQVQGPFPYADCKKLWQQILGDNPQASKRYGDLIPDLDSYFYIVDAHASGVQNVIEWDAAKLMHARGLLKNSFYQMYTRYKSIEWMINQLNTPELYREMAVRDQLRLLLVAFIDHLLQQEREKNRIRQEQYLLSPA